MKQVTVRYFASIREALGRAASAWPPPPPWARCATN
jgi:hypothetical protein